MDIAYTLGDNLYLNLTNECSNNCTFCVRNHSQGLGGYNLWLEKEPTIAEIKTAIGEASHYNEVVFCGFGEPLIRLEEVIHISGWLKTQGVRVRINTNGQGSLIHGHDILPLLQGLVDCLSISLNAQDEEMYVKLCRPQYGPRAYWAMLDFARRASEYVPEVILSVVSVPEVDIGACRQIARALNVQFRVRS